METKKKKRDLMVIALYVSKIDTHLSVACILIQKVI